MNCFWMANLDNIIGTLDESSLLAGAGGTEACDFWVDMLHRMMYFLGHAEWTNGYTVQYSTVQYSTVQYSTVQGYDVIEETSAGDVVGCGLWVYKFKSVEYTHGRSECLWMVGLGKCHASLFALSNISFPQNLILFFHVSLVDFIRGEREEGSSLVGWLDWSPIQCKHNKRQMTFAGVDVVPSIERRRSQRG